MCPLMGEDARTRIARRAAQELVPGQVVNLGVGIPNLIPRFLGAESGVHIQTENGLLGVGPPPRSHEVDGDLMRRGEAARHRPGGCRLLRQR